MIQSVLETALEVTHCLSVFCIKRQREPSAFSFSAKIPLLSPKLPISAQTCLNYINMNRLSVTSKMHTLVGRGGGGGEIPSSTLGDRSTYNSWAFSPGLGPSLGGMFSAACYNSFVFEVVRPKFCTGVGCSKNSSGER